jgi:hypothetical protein
MPIAAKRRGFVLVLLLVAMLLTNACSSDVETGGDDVRLSATAPVAVRMAEVRTSTPQAAVRASTPTPAARASTPTVDAAATRAARPTATWVPLITPSSTPEGGAPGRADVPRIGIAEAKEKMEAGEAILVDVRSQATYEQRHIAGAISMTSSQVAQQYTELPSDKLIIFYCA